MMYMMFYVYAGVIMGVLGKSCWQYLRNKGRCGKDVSFIG